MEQANPAEGVLENPILPTNPDRWRQQVTFDQERELATIQQRTGNTLRPTFGYLQRFAANMSVGEAVIEPNLGSLRVAKTLREDDSVQIGWADDYGPCRPMARYRLDQGFLVRVPGTADRLTIQQQVDQYHRHSRTIRANAARLIAIHLNSGPDSAMYWYAIHGALRGEALFDELDHVVRARPHYKSWIYALSQHLMARTDLGPVPGWGGGFIFEQQTAPTPPHRHRPSRAQGAEPLANGSIPSSTVAKLLDAAFQIGVTAGGSRLFKGQNTFKSNRLSLSPVWRALARQHPAIARELE